MNKKAGQSPLAVILIAGGIGATAFLVGQARRAVHHVGHSVGCLVHKCAPKPAAALDSPR